eukprot:EG_transcript_27970
MLSTAARGLALRLPRPLGLLPGGRGLATQAGPWDIELRFGKHKGLRMSEAPLHYLRWMKKQDLHVKYPELQPGLKALLGDEWDSLDANSTPGGSAASKGPFVMPFGKHKGVPLDQVPKSYLDWLEAAGRMPEDVKNALAKIKAEAAE